MNKKADVDYLKLALISALTGAGTYGLARGTRSAHELMSPPKGPENELSITLPKAKMPPKQEGFQVDKYASLQEFLSGSLGYAAPAMVAGAAGYTGFKGLQGLHSRFRNKALDEEQAKAEQEYMQALQHAAQKTAAAKDTPLVDNFISGMLKQGWSATNIISGIGDHAKETLKQVGDGLANTEAGHLTGGALMGTAGLSALATYYLANRMDRVKEEANSKANIPTEVKLNVK